MGPQQAIQAYGRISRDTRYNTTNQYAVQPFEGVQGSWQTLELQRKNLLNLPTSRLTQIAMDLSPQVNKAIWDLTRFGNPGWVMECETDEGQRVCDEFFDRLTVMHGSVDSLFDTMLTSPFLGGAFFQELVLDETGREAVNISVIDPSTAKFVRRDRQPYGQYWELGQQLGPGVNDWISLQNKPTVKYIGLDSLPDKPYGRPMVTPSIYACIFLLGLTQDLRRIVANQGFNRVDYSINSEELLNLVASSGVETEGDDASIAQLIDKHIADIKAVINTLDVDTDYVHLDTVEVNHAPSGTSNSMPGVEVLVNMIERWIVDGLKSVPMLLGINTATAETHANRQLDFYMAAIRSLQETLADILMHFLKIVLQVRGRRGGVLFYFLEQNIESRLERVRTDKLAVDNVVAQVTAGIITAAEGKAKIEKIEVDYKRKTRL